MNDKQINSKRRFFLGAAGAGSVLAAAVAVSGKKQAVHEAPAAPVEPQTQSGYHETEHIRKYYYTAAYF